MENGFSGNVKLREECVPLAELLVNMLLIEYYPTDILLVRRRTDGIAHKHPARNVASAQSWLGSAFT